LALYLAQHQNELSLPFKRYHNDKVSRGRSAERKVFREFTQCDFI
jgi:histidyl-tRNA synthetase